MAKTLSPVERFARKFTARGLNDCWPWEAATNQDGYGRFWNSKLWMAHRLMWLFEHGTLTDEWLVLHKCDNPGCVNPNHLYLGNKQDNSNDMVIRGRALKGIRNPASKLSLEDVAKIRQLRTDGLTLRKIANRFSMSPEGIRKVLLR